MSMICIQFAATRVPVTQLDRVPALEAGVGGSSPLRNLNDVS